ncbi:PAS domain-containing sensor histidine kinase [Cupriavidus plantarum]|uniref:PAS domain-containing sensor histidine kinase n=2 Tax=Cupriavidus plantarum TaxID=942865 RepID=UPI000E288E9A|nr:PAS domain S-box-containing protein [Cupriavidus plantarum]
MVASTHSEAPPDRSRAGPVSDMLALGETRLAGVIRSAMEAIISVDEAQRIVLFNPMAERLFGCPAESAIGRSLGDFIPERFRAAHSAHVARFGVTGVSDRQMGQQRTLFALRRDGTEFPIEASISQTFEEPGRKLFTVMLRDITERVQAEAALRRSREELQALSDSILSGREEEKRRVARELHDELGQQLSALKMDLVMLEGDLRDARLPDRILAQVTAMHGVIDTTVNAVRRIASDLRPALLDELGLAAGLDWLAKDFGRRYAIDIVVRAVDIPDVGEQVATAAFRIVQEALNNVIQHADARRAWVDLSYVGDAYVLTVRDDGRGWDGTASRDQRRSFGLLGIRERARLLGGTVSMRHAPGEGFQLAVSIPDHP